MGIKTNGMRSLFHATSQGADFSATAMIGRRSLHTDYRRFRDLLSEFGHELI